MKESKLISTLAEGVQASHGKISMTTKNKQKRIETLLLEHLLNQVNASNPLSAVKLIVFVVFLAFPILQYAEMFRPKPLVSRGLLSASQLKEVLRPC